MNIVKNILLLIVSPENGWKEIKKYNVPKEIMLSNAFYPLLAVLAVSSFVQYFFNSELALSYLLQIAIIQVSRFFFGYLISSYLLCSLFPEISNDPKGDNKIHIFILYNYIILLLLSIISNLLPLQIPFLELLPIYLIFIIWRGNKYFKVSISEGRFLALFSLCILLPQLVLRLILKLMIL